MEVDDWNTTMTSDRIMKQRLGTRQPSSERGAGAGVPGGAVHIWMRVRGSCHTK
jgi:hypothetical protein